MSLFKDHFLQSLHMNILLIEDEKKIAQSIVEGLACKDHKVTAVNSGEAGVDIFKPHKFEILIIDVLLKKMSGLEALQAIRQVCPVIPAIILSAQSTLTNKLTAFQAGANDYIQKPFFIEELAARVNVYDIKNILSQRIIKNGPLQLDLISRKVTWINTSTILSQKEFSLLEHMMREPGEIFTRSQLLEKIWNIGFDTQTNVVDVCIQRLKKKIMRNCNNDSQSPIESIRGVGYKIKNLI